LTEPPATATLAAADPLRLPLGCCQEASVRPKKQDGIDLLRKVWLFERCSRRELEALQKIATAVEVPAGRVLTSQGEMGREFFVLVSGKAEAVRDGTSIGVLGPGSFFGEMSLLERKPRAATVTTLEPTSLLVITTGDFNSLVQTIPSVDHKMLVVLADRLRDVEARFVPAESRVANTELA
jgi:CRP/FNR family transcriptional regulator, cyclic AMP receptor protein